MLATKKRLTREAFNRFFASGKRIRSTSFDVVYTPNPTFHASVVVSKKVAKTAVRRNTLRRRIYSLLRSYGTQKGVFIVIVKKTTTPPSHAMVRDELVRVFGTLVK